MEHRFYSFRSPKLIFLLGAILLAACNSLPGPQGINVRSGISIHDIQGAGHISPLNGKEVKGIQGIVTAIRNDGFYIQENQPDGNYATSEGLLVTTQKSPSVHIGDEVILDGIIDEYVPGGISTGNLSITSLRNPQIKIIGNEKPIPPLVIIGEKGRIPPKEKIDSDRMTLFNPEIDGLDFFESLESMMVQVNDAVVVGPTNQYKEVVILADKGRNTGLLSSRGSLVIRESDFNPERIIIDDLFQSIPDLKVGDRIEKPLVGIVDYSFGNFKIQVNSRLIYSGSELKPQSVPMAKPGELTIATLNVNNLDPLDGVKRFDQFANILVN